MRALVALFVGCAVAPATLAEDLDEVRSLLNAGQAAAAYALLTSSAQDAEPSVERRFLLGLAALDSGDVDKARQVAGELARERPQDAAVRALYGRALVAAKAYAEAAREFRAALAGEMPAATRQRIASQLEKLDALAKQAQRTRWQASVAVGGGYDTNANRATEEAIVAVPLFNNLEFLLADRARQTGSALATVDAAAAAEHDFTAHWSGQLRGGVRRLEFTADDARFFDQDTYALSGGVAYAFGRHQVRAELDASWFTVDNDLFRSTAGGTLSWRMQWRAATRFDAFVQGADVTYHPHSVQALRDVTRWVAGAGATQLFGATQKFMISGGFYGGIEEEKSSRAGHLGRSFQGVRVSPQWMPTRRLRLFANFLLEVSDYGAREPLFLRTRDDTYSLAAGGLAWQFAPRWTLEPLVQYVRNRSNLATTDYDSLTGRLSLRFDFH